MTLAPSSTPHTRVAESFSNLSPSLLPVQSSPFLSGYYKCLHTMLHGHKPWLPKIHLQHCCQNNMYLNTSQITALYWERSIPWFLLPSSLAWHIPFTLWLRHCLLVQLILMLCTCYLWSDTKKFLNMHNSVNYSVVVGVWRVEKNGEEDLGNGIKWLLIIFINSLVNFLNKI